MLTNVRLRRVRSNVYEITGLTPRKSLELRCSRCLRWFSPRLLTVDLNTDEVLCIQCLVELDSTHDASRRWEEEEGPCA